MKYFVALLAIVSAVAGAKEVEVGDYNPGQTVTCSKTLHIYNCK